MRRIVSLISVSLLLGLSGPASAGWGWFSLGLDRDAKKELADAGVNKYLGRFHPQPAEDAGAGWERFRFTQSVDGPLCLVGEEYSVFARRRDPNKLLIFTQGGGACWENFYFCSFNINGQLPPPPQAGIWSDNGVDTPLGNIPNPLADYSVLYMPYCDGSVFTGDNDVVDANLAPFGGIRFHRGLKNLSAGMDVAKDLFPHARKIVVAGSSAGGVGAASFAPFLVRFLYGNYVDLAVYNDAGPNALNPVAMQIPGQLDTLARANDWQFGQFYPASCTGCDVLGQGTEIVKWRLANDSTVRESFYSTDGDITNRFFLQVPTQELYRGLIVPEHGAINEAHPFRYKRFIQSGSDIHTSLQTPLFYLNTAAGIPQTLWTTDFLEPPFLRWLKALRDGRVPVWLDAVDDFVPLP
ncbi:MAG: pectin acetylesterase-family hydrolase [Woeseiaceae bacterium]|nr:pectin acetylesterase-family hydrolase [Woeseiaceae bacterium]